MRVNVGVSGAVSVSISWQARIERLPGRRSEEFPGKFFSDRLVSNEAKVEVPRRQTIGRGMCDTGQTKSKASLGK